MGITNLELTIKIVIFQKQNTVLLYIGNYMRNTEAVRFDDFSENSEFINFIAPDKPNSNFQKVVTLYPRN